MGEFNGDVDMTDEESMHWESSQSSTIKFQDPLLQFQHKHGPIFPRSKHLTYEEIENTDSDTSTHYRRSTKSTNHPLFEQKPTIQFRRRPKLKTKPTKISNSQFERALSYDSYNFFDSK